MVHSVHDSRVLGKTNPFLDLDTLSVADLVATVIQPSPGRASRRKGARYKTAVDLLDALGGLTGLSRAGVDEIASLLGETKSEARALVAAFELGRRAAEEPTSQRPRIRDSRDVAAWGTRRIGGLEHEELWLIAVDGRSLFRAARRIAQGGLHGMSVRPSDPLRHALRVAASAFCLLHNHPSGDPTPSAEDVAFTESVARAAAIVGLPMLDHVVVTRHGYASVPLPPAA